MKKYGSVVAAFLLAAALCGCSGKGNSSQSGSSTTPDAIVVSSVESMSSVHSSTAASSSPAYSSSAAESSSPTESTSSGGNSVPQVDDATFLVGLAGDTILKSEITTVFTNDGSDCTPDDLTEDVFSAVLCKGFTYVAEPSRVSRNTLDHADVFDSGEMRFTDMSEPVVKNYVRLNVGDTICGMTLKSAEVNFARGSEQETFEMKDGSFKKGSELGLKEIYFNGSTAEFEGEFEMTGYICRIVEDVYGIGTGDIIFVPCDGEADFPVMSYRLSGDDGFYHTSQVYSLVGLIWQNEFGYVRLGNVNDTTADVSGLPGDGSFVKARVTADGLKLSCGLNFVSTISAELTDVTVL